MQKLLSHSASSQQLVKLVSPLYIFS